MSRPHPRLTRLVVTTALVLLVPWAAAAQDPGGRMTLSATADSPTLQASIALVDRMLLGSELVLLSAERDRSFFSRTHETLAQVHRGVPVYGGSVTRQRAVGQTISVLGTIYQGLDVETTPGMAANEALGLLVELSGNASVSAGLPTLTILPTPDGGFVLTYRATMADYTTYFIDANSGRLVITTSEIDTQSAIGIGMGALGDLKKVSARRTGGEFTTEDELRPTSIITADSNGDPDALDRMLLAVVQPQLGGFLQSDIPSDSDNDWRAPSQAGIVDGHVETGFTHDYFLLQHNWPGMDGAGGRVYDIVNDFDVLPSNAFFVRPPFGPQGNGAMAWGETSTAVPVNTLDIVGHEYMHGVTHFAIAARSGGLGLDSRLVADGLGPVFLREPDGTTFSCAALVALGNPFVCDPASGRFAMTSNQSGAINESFADVFGTSTEFFYQAPGNGPLQADYLSGEDVVGFGPFRSLIDPASIPVIGPLSYPDHFSTRFRFPAAFSQNSGVLFLLVFVDPNATVSDYIELSSSDSGAVHLNATFLGHAFYLAIEGGTNATSGQTLLGAGAANRALIEEVFFRAMVTLMPQSPTFDIAAAALRQAAIDLYGSGSGASNAMSSALTAVGLGPAGGASAPIAPQLKPEDKARPPDIDPGAAQAPPSPRAPGPRSPSIPGPTVSPRGD